MLTLLTMGGTALCLTFYIFPILISPIVDLIYSVFGMNGFLLSIEVLREISFEKASPWIEDSWEAPRRGIIIMLSIWSGDGIRPSMI